ncbi:hypothetical protein [Opitutus terrae]|uniref:Uncharacterized protein n=1 Tax=Opitutus terrae (strain DSM 11246 / JCM 15787 / PB90-1) TaxID=452637 RepID=B1ZYW3_OPITP|nr:hypothetical protein [Opitutus terrae]ACB76286.1 hypothetical protein Oter_3005 [Opitutus terrae PB90-1]
MSRVPPPRPKARRLLDVIVDTIARAAKALRSRPRTWMDGHEPSALAQRWAGKFTLPEDDPSDPRLVYLLERYRRLRE